MANMLEALTSYQGLEHRCQTVTSDDGILWINDSKATNVGATVAAIDGLAPMLTGASQLFLIAGGDGKGADFSPLNAVIAEHVSEIYALGKDKQAMLALTANGHAVDSIEQAVSLCRAKAKPGDIVLLSPACASIDMFANFAARGQAFVNAVHNVKEAANGS